jgi:hypothetical protein
MVKTLHKMGMRSGHAYLAGIGSIGLSIAVWAVSLSTERAGIDRADRWGIFIGQWAPTFFALGNGLRTYEMPMAEEPTGAEMRAMEEPRVGR